MNYILYNPKANNENNDINIINVSEDSVSVKKISLIDLDIPAFFAEVNENDKVFVCGGDGTLCRFANNVYNIDIPCPLYALRSGTGNDFLNDVGQGKTDAPKDVRKFFKNLPEVRINGGEQIIRCINGAGLGLDGVVCNGVEEFKKNTNKKKANYTTIALKELTYKYKGPNAKLTVDGKVYEYENVWAMSTMKGRYYGGGMMVAPSQDRESGKVSVMAMHGGNRLKALVAFSKVKKGTHIEHKDMVEIIEGYNVTVEFDSPSYLQIDGEVYADVTSYSVSCRRPEVEEVKEAEAAAEI